MKNKRTELYNRNQSIMSKKIHYLDMEAQSIIECFRDNIKRIREQFNTVDLLKSQKKYDEANDILRFQIVYGMSALDYFMHEVYVYCFLKIFKKELPKTERYNEYRIPLSLLEQALYNAENFDVYLKDAFTEINSNFTFMASNRIKELLNIITDEDEFAIAERKLKNKKIISQNVKLANVLDDIYKRRNKIAHQTDITHGNDSRTNITKELVEYYIDVIENFIEEIFKVIIRQTMPEA